MAIATAPRVLPLGLATPSVRQAGAAAEDARAAKARRRFVMARVAATAESLPEARRMIALWAAAEQGTAEISWTDLPSLKTLARLKARWDAGAQSVDDYRDEPRSGRPRIVLTPSCEGIVRDFVLTDRGASVRRLTAKLAEAAAKDQVPAPSASTIARRLSAQRLERTAARYGRKVAEMEALPHSTVPVDFTHEVWTLDELTSPVWASMYCDRENAWVPIRPDVVLLMDSASRAILSLHVCDPARRRDADGRRPRGGHDREDVLATLFSAAVPELAEPAMCAPLAGHLPKVLRLDNAKSHIAMRDGGDASRDAETYAALTSLIEIPKLPSQRPINRGSVERAVRTLKELCDELWCHVDRVQPVEWNPETPAAERSRAAGAGDRVPRRSQVTAESLPTIRELEAMLAPLVARFNRTRRDVLEGLSPEQAYRAKMPRQPRKGRDLLSILPARTGVVGPKGLTFQRNKVPHAFAAATKSFWFKVDTTLTYRVDPLCRAVFAVHGKEQLVLPRLADAARRQDPAKFAKQQAAAVRYVSQIADEAAREAALAAASRQIVEGATAQALARASEPGAATPMPAQGAAVSPTPNEALSAEIARNAPRRRPPLPGAKGFAPRRADDDAPKS
ncbi:hypothetical protein [Gemmatimonas sp.]|uniref:hypothetical protein n=1 Tax=Gemmatimonas sp. TaxID=1962908 RepID=UPI0025BA9EC6|nr:hypothetical protein [Gemmatimonas sp.]MCA2991623.1 hypothetical protein [Gemmatimonas sp.]